MVGGAGSSNAKVTRGGNSIAHARMDAINEETMSQYFNLLKDVLDECILKDHPANIYNVDESGISELQMW